MKSVESSFSQLLFKLNSEKFFAVRRLRLLFNEVKCVLEAVCGPATDSCSASTCQGSNINY